MTNAMTLTETGNWANLNTVAALTEAQHTAIIMAAKDAAASILQHWTSRLSECDMSQDDETSWFGPVNSSILPSGFATMPWRDAETGMTEADWAGLGMPRGARFRAVVRGGELDVEIWLTSPWFVEPQVVTSKSWTEPVGRRVPFFHSFGVTHSNGEFWVDSRGRFIPRHQLVTPDQWTVPTVAVS